ncbi:MAG: SsrA-binding protein SmpB [Bacteroidetes bacterium]|nr:MAG: SsrA-binding protein SmpB [Bacteroidota bacterium]
MSEKGRNTTVIFNRKASYEYELIDSYTAGIQLRGTEVKSLRLGRANLQEAYCFVENDEVFIKGMNISEYDKASYNNHDPLRVRKLLLKKKEIVKMRKALEQKGLTLVPQKIYFNDRNFVKLDLILAKGKKLYDKRDSVKEKDTKRELDRHMKKYA